MIEIRPSPSNEVVNRNNLSLAHEPVLMQGFCVIAIMLPMKITGSVMNIPITCITCEVMIMQLLRQLTSKHGENKAY
jgi:hypothetical protein